ncbi:hypothetical protein OF117_21020 [Geodermatophilus sp. YIM 151500]|uniref:hypothetical protein n=1 Tax=Geodermatophilus sp. YIM 151500 TaxID=2984531 RepID=UPI0021E3EDEF|nr:hypothetical protein [Geodermatophilus sp. YIM 151500]MCV2491834.1 hypothetical protein [Geodermatophilus sp. YIM 151500]
MGLLDRLLGRDRPAQSTPASRPAPPSGPVPPAPSGTPRSEDERAIERYRYLLRTAPPEQVEQAHAEAFARLTPEQRQQVLAQLAGDVPAGERPGSDDPQALARAATRAEMRAPGTLERALGGAGAGRGGPGFGSMVGASLLGTVSGLVLGTAVADALFDTPGEAGFDGAEGAGAAPADSGDGFAAEDLGGGYFHGGDADGGLGAGDLGGGDLGGI